jgi:quercetin dioxygenase-like cupin family protein
MSKLDDSIEALERDTQMEIVDTLHKFRMVAAAYDLPFLMLDSLQSTEVGGLRVQTKDGEWKCPSDLSDDSIVRIKHECLAKLLHRYRTTMGEKVEMVETRLNLLRQTKSLGGASSRFGTATYEVPMTRVEHSRDYAIVRVTFKAKGESSDKHCHPGDELVYVANGIVEAHLEDTGIIVQLGPHDVLAFHSEQRHSLKCISETAELLVVRFLQLDRLSARYQFLEDLRTPKDVHVFARLLAEMKNALQPFELHSGSGAVPWNDREVVDRHEFGRFLRTALVDTFSPVDPQSKRNRRRQQSTPEVQQAMAERRNRKYLLRKGALPIQGSKLPELADEFGLERFLLYEHLIPKYRQAIVIRALAASGESDWEPVPKEFQSSEGVRYFVPKRRLADSGISIARIELKPGAKTRQNVHAGREVLIGLAGTVTVQIGNDPPDVSHETDAYAEYNSNVPHSVANTHQVDAICLVFRFYPSMKEQIKKKEG